MIKGYLQALIFFKSPAKSNFFFYQEILIHAFMERIITAWNISRELTGIQYFL